MNWRTTASQRATTSGCRPATANLPNSSRTSSSATPTQHGIGCRGDKRDHHVGRGDRVTGRHLGRRRRTHRRRPARLAVFLLGVVVVVLLSSCPEPTLTAQLHQEFYSHSVTYDGHGNDSGTVPTDANNYEEGATVSLLPSPVTPRLLERIGTTTTAHTRVQPTFCCIGKPRSPTHEEDRPVQRVKRDQAPEAPTNYQRLSLRQVDV